VIRSSWQPTLGAVVDGDGVTFRVWAPKLDRLDLLLDGVAIPMKRQGQYFTEPVPGVRAGSHYRFRVPGVGDFPDPCSRSQPEGVHGPSEVIDPARFRWTDAAWRPPAATERVFYECHVGTLTPEGTFDSAIGQLGRLKDLGVTVVELMPVAAFPGRWNWGYDGAALFAPAAVYGGPEGLRRLVDAAHAAGLAVCLDVVYNHFGPDGNYTGVYSDQYRTSRHMTPWGDAVNFDGDGSAEVRRFFAENLLHWAHEYHIDGFRLDATHAIFDDSPVHILAELSQVMHEHPRGEVAPFLVAESHENDLRYLQPREDGGFGFDGVWADDFHHIMRTILLGEREGYFASFEGTTEELVRVVEQGFYYEGQYDPWPREPRGTRAREQPPHQFVFCIQNHDQVGNRPFGTRMNATVSHADFLAATLVLLLLPQTPLLFQGQEFLASTPFLYFTDHNHELGRLVTEGRRREFASWAAFRDERLRQQIPDPQDPRTFLRSKLRLDESEFGTGKLAVEFHRELLALRRSDPVLRAARARRMPVAGMASGRAAVLDLQAGGERRVIAVNFGEATAVPTVDAGRLRLVLHSGEPRFGGNAAEPVAEGGAIRLPAHHAAFFLHEPSA
jgi:maltooligosyltrehalose trehalohydrolase